jgi:hypothetical protein
MAPSVPEDGALQRLSPLTLAALADSGWWVVVMPEEEEEVGEGSNRGDRSSSLVFPGAPMEWGRGAGCEFVTRPCSEWAAAAAADADASAAAAAAASSTHQPYFCPGLPTPGYADGQLLVEAGLVPASKAPAAVSRSACTPDGRALATCSDSPGPGRFTNGCVLAASSAPYAAGPRLSCSGGSDDGGGGDGNDDDEWWSSRELRVFAAMGGGAGGSGKYCAVPASSDPSDRICPIMVYGAAEKGAAATGRRQRRQRQQAAGGWLLGGGGGGEQHAAAAGTTCASEAAMGTYWCVSARCVAGDQVALEVRLPLQDDQGGDGGGGGGGGGGGATRLVPCERGGGGGGAMGAAEPSPLLPWERGVADLAAQLPSAFRSGRVSCPPAATVCAEERAREGWKGGGGSGCDPAACAPPYGECVKGACRCLRLDAYGPACRQSVIPDPPAPYYRRLRPHGG